MKVNIAKETRRLPGTALPRELEALFASAGGAANDAHSAAAS